MVDRITPERPHRTNRGRSPRRPASTTPPGGHRAVQRMGAQRRLPRRPAGMGRRPAPRFVDDIDPYEDRKLWLLNGAHSLLAYAGIAARSPDRGRGGRRPGVPGVDAAVVGRRPPGISTLPAPEVVGLPRRAARPVRQPPDASPARPDRRRRLAEAPGPDPARPARRTRRRTDPRRAPPTRWGRGSATCAEPGPRSGSASTTCIPTGWCRSRRARCPTRSAECWTASTPRWEPTTTW